MKESLSSVVTCTTIVLSFVSMPKRKDKIMIILAEISGLVSIPLIHFNISLYVFLLSKILQCSYPCRVHKNIEIEELAAKYLLQLEPHDSSSCLFLSNAYAVAGKWACL
jgi:hypothetical protein